MLSTIAYMGLITAMIWREVLAQFAAPDSNKY